MREWCFQIYLYENEELVYEDDDERWALYDSEVYQDFFSDGYRSMSGNHSEDGHYTVSWYRKSRERGNTVVPAGFCIIEDGSVRTTVEIDGVSKAEIANDGTVALFRESNQFLVFNSAGEEIFRESFESAVMMVNVSQDGEYAVLSTAYPDNAVHMYEAQSGQYLGRVENTGQGVIQYMDFTSDIGKTKLRTYNSTPNIRDDVHPNRREPMAEISVKPQFDITEVDGIGVISDSSDGLWHHIPEDEVQGVEGRLRIPGVTLQSSCNKQISLIDSYLIYNDVDEALNESIDFCKQCQESVAVYPDEKVERTPKNRAGR